MSRYRYWITRLVLLATLLVWSGQADARKFLDAAGEADKAILNDLHNGRIVEARPFGANGNTGSLWKVKIEHNGNTRWAVFKPRDFGDRDGWARTPMEVAMYKLNRILGMDMVPPTAYRRNVNLNGQHFGEGALMVWVDDSHGVNGVAKNLWKPRHEAFSSDLRILQILGRDADHQNAANILRGKHWRDGKYRMIKVDNEACMRPGSYLELQHNSAIWGQVFRFNKTTYNRLKELNFNDLKADVGEFMSDGEIRDWLKTRDGIVNLIGHLRREKGDGGVFFSKAEVAFDARKDRGRKAKGKDLSKFERLLKKKGVKVEFVNPKDPSLKGAVGKTVLTKLGITVRIARSNKQAVSMGTLVEELVHVNQLRRMSRSAGGLARLHGALAGKGKKVRAIKASMEAYAKGKVATFASTSRVQKTKVKRSQRRFQRQVARYAGNNRPANSFWKTALQSPRPRRARR